MAPLKLLCAMPLLAAVVLATDAAEATDTSSGGGSSPSGTSNATTSTGTAGSTVVSPSGGAGTGAGVPGAVGSSSGGPSVSSGTGVDTASAGRRSGSPVTSGSGSAGASSGTVLPASPTGGSGGSTGPSGADSGRTSPGGVSPSSPAATKPAAPSRTPAEVGVRGAAAAREGVTLDLALNKPGDERVKLLKGVKDGLTVYVYTPVDPHRITRVVHGSHELEVPNGKTVKAVALFTEGGVTVFNVLTGAKDAAEPSDWKKGANGDLAYVKEGGLLKKVHSRDERASISDAAQAAVEKYAEVFERFDMESFEECAVVESSFSPSYVIYGTTALLVLLVSL